MTTKTRRQYTEDFKAEAVRLVGDSAQSVAHVARNLAMPTICSTVGGPSNTRRNARATHASRCVRNRRSVHG